MGFPPFMPTPLAALYCGFRTAKGLHAAFRKGKVLEAGAGRDVGILRAGAPGACYPGPSTRDRPAYRIQEQMRAQASLRTQEDFARFIRWQTDTLRNAHH
jgi:hypothetical protein